MRINMFMLNLVFFYAQARTQRCSWWQRIVTTWVLESSGHVLTVKADNTSLDIVNCIFRLWKRVLTCLIYICSFKCLRMHSKAKLMTENCHYMGYSVIWVGLYSKSLQYITRHLKTRFQALIMRFNMFGFHICSMPKNAPKAADDGWEKSLQGF